MPGEFTIGPDYLRKSAASNVAVETEILAIDGYEVQLYDLRHNRRLVAAIEIVSPSNKDRPESRLAFTARCAALLRKGVSVAIADGVIDRNFNLYAELLEMVGQHDPSAKFGLSTRTELS